MSIDTNPISKIVFTETQDTLANGASIETGYIIQSGSADKYQISWIADVAGLTLTTTSQSISSDTEFTNSFTFTASRFFLGSFPVRQRRIKFILTNNTGATVNDVNLEIKATYGSADKASVFPIDVAPRVFSPALLTQSVLKGKDPSDNFLNVGVNEAGALLTSNFGIEVARGLYAGYALQIKNGRNPDVDTASAPEDLWNGGSLYTGFNATADEDISVSSASASDSGTLVSSGTATGGSSTALIDTGATFVTDGVAVGDCVMIDSKGVHGSITAVTETQLTVFRWNDGAENGHVAASGDTYRVATTASTGAAVLRLSQLLNSGYIEQTPAYVILNGTSTVTLTGSYMRCPRGEVVLAGSGGLNAGQLTVTQATTTANVFCIIPTFGKSTIGCLTVPKGKLIVVDRIYGGLVRASGAAGSGTLLLNSRLVGGAWQGIPFELSTAGRLSEDFEGGYIYPEGTDVKFTVSQVSDNNTIVDASLEYYTIDL